MAVIKKILTPVDFSDSSAAAVRNAETLAHAVGAELVLLHVISDPVFAYAEGGGTISPRLIAEYEQAMKGKLEDVRNGVRKDITVSMATAHGIPHEAIVAKADKEQYDLIVMGTQGRSGLNHLLLGSVAERVVRLSRVPVLTVRAS